MSLAEAAVKIREEWASKPPLQGTPLPLSHEGFGPWFHRVLESEGGLIAEPRDPTKASCTGSPPWPLQNYQKIVGYLIGTTPPLSRCTLVKADTGAGKTCMMIHAIEVFRRNPANAAKKIIVVVPSDKTRNNFSKEIRQSCPSSMQEHLKDIEFKTSGTPSGDPLEKALNIVVMTYLQLANRFRDNGGARYLDNTLILLDEVHYLVDPGRIGNGKPKEAVEKVAALMPTSKRYTLMGFTATPFMKNPIGDLMKLIAILTSGETKMSPDEFRRKFTEKAKYDTISRRFLDEGSPMMKSRIRYMTIATELGVANEDTKEPPPITEVIRAARERGQPQMETEIMACHEHFSNTSDKEKVGADHDLKREIMEAFGDQPDTAAKLAGLVDSNIVTIDRMTTDIEKLRELDAMLRGKVMVVSMENAHDQFARYRKKTLVNVPLSAEQVKGATSTSSTNVMFRMQYVNAVYNLVKRGSTDIPFSTQRTLLRDDAVMQKKAPKYFRAYTDLMAYLDGGGMKTMVYSDMPTISFGVGLFANLLVARGWTNLSNPNKVKPAELFAKVSAQKEALRARLQASGTPEEEIERQVRAVRLKNFITFSTNYVDPTTGKAPEVTDKTKDAYLSAWLNIFNDSKYNVWGETIPIILLDYTGKEGVSLRTVCNVVMIDAPKSEGDYIQVIGRARRMLSHCALPKSLWNIDITIYQSVPHGTPESIIDGNASASEGDSTATNFIHKILEQQKEASSIMGEAEMQMKMSEASKEGIDDASAIVALAKKGSRSFAPVSIEKVKEMAGAGAAAHMSKFRSIIAHADEAMAKAKMELDAMHAIWKEPPPTLTKKGTVRKKTKAQEVAEQNRPEHHRRLAQLRDEIREVVTKKLEESSTDAMDAIWNQITGKKLGAKETELVKKNIPYDSAIYEKAQHMYVLDKNLSDMLTNMAMDCSAEKALNGTSTCYFERLWGLKGEKYFRENTIDSKYDLTMGDRPPAPATAIELDDEAELEETKTAWDDDRKPRSMDDEELTPIMADVGAGGFKSSIDDLFPGGEQKPITPDFGKEDELSRLDGVLLGGEQPNEEQGPVMPDFGKEDELTPLDGILLGSDQPSGEQGPIMQDFGEEDELTPLALGEEQQGAGANSESTPLDGVLLGGEQPSTTPDFGEEDELTADGVPARKRAPRKKRVHKKEGWQWALDLVLGEGNYRLLRDTVLDPYVKVLAGDVAIGVWPLEFINKYVKSRQFMRDAWTHWLMNIFPTFPFDPRDKEGEEEMKAFFSRAEGQFARRLYDQREAVMVRLPEVPDLPSLTSKTEGINAFERLFSVLFGSRMPESFVALQKASKSNYTVVPGWRPPGDVSYSSAIQDNTTVALQEAIAAHITLGAFKQSGDDIFITEDGVRKNVFVLDVDRQRSTGGVLNTWCPTRDLGNIPLFECRFAKLNITASEIRTVHGIRGNVGSGRKMERLVKEYTRLCMSRDAVAREKGHTWVVRYINLKVAPIHPDPAHPYYYIPVPVFRKLGEPGNWTATPKPEDFPGLVFVMTRPKKTIFKDAWKKVRSGNNYTLLRDHTEVENKMAEVYIPELGSFAQSCIIDAFKDQ